MIKREGYRRLKTVETEVQMGQMGQNFTFHDRFTCTMMQKANLS